MNVIIYQPAKSAMQSGRGHTKKWVVEPCNKEDTVPGALMGWSRTPGTKAQIKMYFSTLEEAQRFALRKGWDVQVDPGQQRKIKPRNYGDNFRYVPTGEE